MTIYLLTAKTEFAKKKSACKYFSNLRFELESNWLGCVFVILFQRLLFNVCSQFAFNKVKVGQKCHWDYFLLKKSYSDRPTSQLVRPTNQPTSLLAANIDYDDNNWYDDVNADGWMTTDRLMDGWMDGWMNDWMDTPRNRCMDGWIGWFCWCTQIYRNNNY